MKRVKSAEHDISGDQEAGTRRLHSSRTNEEEFLRLPHL